MGRIITYECDICGKTVSGKVGFPDTWKSNDSAFTDVECDECIRELTVSIKAAVAVTKAKRREKKNG